MATTKSPTVDAFLCESFQGMSEGRKFDSTDIEEKLAEFDYAVLEGRFDPNDIDYNEVVRKVMPDPLFQAFRNDRPGRSKSDRKMLVENAMPAVRDTHFDLLWDRLITRHMKNWRPTQSMSLDRALSILKEEAVTPITASQIDKFRERCTNRIVSDFSCPPSSLAFQDIFTRVDDPCSDFRDNKICEFPLDPPPDLCCADSNDDDPAQFYGLGPQRCWKMPHPCFISFAFGMHRNLVCVNANEFVRQQIDARQQWFGIIDEWKRTRLLFNAFDSTNCDKYTYNYDGVTYTTGWKSASDGAPWTNVVTNPALAWTTCSEGPMCAIEQIFEDQRDPTNQFPVDCGGPFEVILTRDCTKYKYWEVTGAREFTRSLSDASCCGTAASMRSPREGWPTGFRYSRWAWDILVDFYLNHYSGTYNGTAFANLATRLAGDPALAQRTAEYYAENTYVVSKSLARTFGTIVDFDVSTREISGTDTWMYFDRGITWARRYDRKQTDAWMRPWLTILVRAFDPLKDADGAVI